MAGPQVAQGVGEGGRRRRKRRKRREGERVGREGKGLGSEGEGGVFPSCKPLCLLVLAPVKELPGNKIDGLCLGGLLPGRP